MTYSTQIVRFLDRGEQRYRQRAKVLRRWVMRLDLLDEEELSGIELFFLSRQGQAGSFEFTDPADNLTYPNCSFESNSLETEWTGVHAGKSILVVRDNEA